MLVSCGVGVLGGLLARVLRVLVSDTLESVQKKKNHCSYTHECGLIDHCLYKIIFYNYIHFQVRLPTVAEDVSDEKLAAQLVGTGLALLQLQPCVSVPGEISLSGAYKAQKKYRSKIVFFF